MGGPPWIVKFHDVDVMLDSVQVLDVMLLDSDSVHVLDADALGSTRSLNGAPVGGGGTGIVVKLLWSVIVIAVVQLTEVVVVGEVVTVDVVLAWHFALPSSTVKEPLSPPPGYTVPW